MPLPAIYTDNAPTPAQQTNVGFKISKPGYDANRTAGNNFTFNSSWPSLPIAFETTLNNPASNQVVPHGLKFAPFAMVWTYGGDPSGLGQVAKRYIAMADGTNIYLSAGGTIVKVRAFQLDLSIDVDYALAPGDTFNFPYDNNFGIKAVKPNRSIDSRDLRDFTVHSRAQSPLILAVKTQKTIPAANYGTGIGDVVQYTSKLKYPVWVYGFVKAGATIAGNYGVPVNTYIPAGYYSQGYPRTFTDGFTSYISYAFGDAGATLVVLRDPMFAASQTTVQY